MNDASPTSMMTFRRSNLTWVTLNCNHFSNFERLHFHENHRFLQINVKQNFYKQYKREKCLFFRKFKICIKIPCKRLQNDYFTNICWMLLRTTLLILKRFLKFPIKFSRRDIKGFMFDKKLVLFHLSLQLNCCINQPIINQIYLQLRWINNESISYYVIFLLWRT